MKGSRRHSFKSVFLLIVLCCFFVSCTSISTKTYVLESPLLKKQSTITIVLIADLHSTIHGENQSLLIKKITELNPDLIVLAGDIYDDIKPITGTQLLLAGISDIAPIFYVTGNHEYKNRNMQAIRDDLESNGVVILSDIYVKIEVGTNELIIAGIDDPGKANYEATEYIQSESMEKAFRELDSISVYTIFIAHRPEKIELYKQYSFDLVLSGHTHGGQVRLPFINGLYAPNQGVFPKYAGGLYTHGNLTHIISRGLSISPGRPRIFNSPELVVIIIGGQ